MDRVHAVATHRKKSKRQTTNELAEVPACFGEIRQPDRAYLLIPSVSSERRRYIPIGFMRPQVIASNLVLLVPGANLYHFGVLSSAMHMAWVRQVAGRLESRYRYSNRIVYNNYPWPAEPTAASAAASRRRRNGLGSPGRTGGRTGRVPSHGRRRQPHRLPGRPLRPRRHAAAVHKAIPALDLAVDRCYRRQPFTSDRQRIEFLFALYEAIAAPLIPTTRQRQRSFLTSRRDRPAAAPTSGP